MKFAASVSLAALALAACATNPQLAADSSTAPPPPAANAGPALTPDGAREFIAAVEKDLFDLNVISQHAAWANATYINDDTDAVNAYFGTIGTEKGVQYAKEAAKYAAVPGSSRHRPQSPRLRGALGLAARRTRVGGGAQQYHDQAAVDLRQGPGDPQRQVHHRR